MRQREHVKSSLAVERGGLSTMSYGIAERCFEIARDYALQRQQFGQPIANFQLVQNRLARMYVAALLSKLRVQTGREDRMAANLRPSVGNSKTRSLASACSVFTMKSMKFHEERERAILLQILILHGLHALHGEIKALRLTFPAITRSKPPTAIWTRVMSPCPTAAASSTPITSPAER